MPEKNTFMLAMTAMLAKQLDKKQQAEANIKKEVEQPPSTETAYMDEVSRGFKQLQEQQMKLNQMMENMQTMMKKKAAVQAMSAFGGSSAILGAGMAASPSMYPQQWTIPQTSASLGAVPGGSSTGFQNQTSLQSLMGTANSPVDGRREVDQIPVTSQSVIPNQNLTPEQYAQLLALMGQSPVQSDLQSKPWSGGYK